MPTIAFDEILKDHLQDAESVAIFLNDAIESGSTEEIAQAMEKVMMVHGDKLDWDVLSLYVPKILTQLRKYGLSLEFRPSTVAVHPH
jgi:hypothetical protein